VDGEIRSRSSSSFWNSNEEEGMSERFARGREKRRCRSEIKRGSRRTADRRRPRFPVAARQVL
jgi:hypothetical protein